MASHFERFERLSAEEALSPGRVAGTGGGGSGGGSGSSSGMMGSPAIGVGGGAVAPFRMEPLETADYGGTEMLASAAVGSSTGSGGGGRGGGGARTDQHQRQYFYSKVDGGGMDALGGRGGSGGGRRSMGAGGAAEQGMVVGPLAESGMVTPSWKFDLLWVVVSCGYMAPWTSIGALIAYVKARYSAAFYVRIYCAFYLPGLPVSLLQQHLDESVDRAWGSRVSFLWRNLLGYVVLIAVLLVFPAILAHKHAVVFCMAVMGVFSWLSHGWACTLASMFPPRSLMMLQSGFRTPELYSFVVVASLHLGAAATHAHIVQYSLLTAGLVLCGLIAWVIIVQSPAAQTCLAIKDRNMYGSADEQKPLVVLGGGTSSYNAAAEYKREAAERERKAEVAAAVLPCRVAVFLTIWASIFTAAFFAYVKSSAPTSSWRYANLEQVLYFVRLFADLLGRPLTQLPRPRFLLTGRSVAWAATARLGLSAVFFLYIIVPAFPRSDAFVIGLVAVFSVLSGYLTVLAYEYAAQAVADKASQTYAALLMNSGFQIAAFTAVVMGVLFSDAAHTLT